MQMLVLALWRSKTNTLLVSVYDMILRASLRCRYRAFGAANLYQGALNLGNEALNLANRAIDQVTVRAAMRAGGAFLHCARVGRAGYVPLLGAFNGCGIGKCATN